MDWEKFTLKKWEELTPAKEEEFIDAWTDEHGVKYSQDRKRLLHNTNPNLTSYTVPEGTEVICDNAFCLTRTYIKNMR